MSYRSALSQRELDGIYYDNSSATNQSVSETNTSYLANLLYVQNWVAQAYSGFMLILNPVFTGTMTGSNITLTGELSTPTITSNTNFTQIPTITIGSTIYNVSTVPAGTIKMTISNTNIPVGYLLCDGSTYSSTDYPNLFNAIQYTYGGSGSSFNVPNFESYFPIGGNGVNASGCATSNYVTGNGTSGATNTFSTTANFGGSSTAVAPLQTIVCSHTHSISDPGHTHQSVVYVGQAPYLTLPPTGQQCIIPSLGSTTLSTTASTANVIIGNTGTDIQTTDGISNLTGVNVSPPYVACFFYIATG
jgi:microcystin-dependent protein